MPEYQVVINNGNISIYKASCNSYIKEIVFQKQIDYYKCFNKLLINRYINNLGIVLSELNDLYHPDCIYILLENSTEVIRLIDILCLRIFGKQVRVINKEKYRILMYRILEKGKLKFWLLGKSIYVGYINNGIRIVNVFTSTDCDENNIFLKALQYNLPDIGAVYEIECSPCMFGHSIMKFINSTYPGVKIKMIYNTSYYE